MIVEHQNKYVLTDMFALLDVSSAGFYEWKNRKESKPSLENRKLKDYIIIDLMIVIVGNGVVKY